MNVEPADSRTILSAALGILMAVLAWIWARLVGQQDRHEKRLAELEKTVATKGDITAVYEKLSDLQVQSHQHHTQLLNTILNKRRD